MSERKLIMKAVFILLMLPFASNLFFGVAEASNWVIPIDCGVSSGATVDSQFRQALSRAREIRQSDASSQISIKFGSGICRTSGLSLGAQDSGTNGMPLVIEGSATGTTFLTGSVALKESAPSKNSENSQQKTFLLTQSDISRLRSRNAAGYDDGRIGAALVVAQSSHPLNWTRWPATGYRSFTVGAPQKAPDVRPTIAIDPAQLEAWKADDELWAGGFWTSRYFYNLVQVKSRDASSSSITLDRLPTGYPESKTIFYEINNTSEDLTAAGQYYYSLRRGELYTIPIAAIPWGVESAQTDDALTISNAKNIVVRGLAIINVLRDGVHIVSSSAITISDGLIRNSGRNGVLVTGSHDISIDRMVISDIGCTGVEVLGGDIHSLDEGRIYIRESILQRFGQRQRAYMPGVRLRGVGNGVIDSFLVDAPHSAIIYEGNNHKITGNEIAHVVRETDDAGAIYSGRNLLWRGNQITDNYFRDIIPDVGPGEMVKGVYLDDWLSDQTVQKNVFYNVSYPIHIHGGSYNKVDNNNFMCFSHMAIWIQDASRAWARNIPILQKSVGSNPAYELYLKTYPTLSDTFKHDGHPVDNELRANVVHGMGDTVNSDALASVISVDNTRVPSGDCNAAGSAHGYSPTRNPNLSRLQGLRMLN